MTCVLTLRVVCILVSIVLSWLRSGFVDPGGALWLLRKVRIVTVSMFVCVVRCSSVNMRDLRSRMLFLESSFSMRSCWLSVVRCVKRLMKVGPCVKSLLVSVVLTWARLRQMTWLVLTPTRLILEPFTRLLGRFMCTLRALISARG